MRNERVLCPSTVGMVNEVITNVNTYSQIIIITSIVNVPPVKRRLTAEIIIIIL